MVALPSKTERTDEELTALKARFATDLPFYARHALFIRTKRGRLEPLVFNHAQDDFWRVVSRQREANQPVRIIVLKARQLGMSTGIGGLLYWDVSQNSGRRAMVVTHSSDATRNLFDMTRRFHANCPDMLKPHTRYSSRRELFFDILDSSFIVATAGGESIGRSDTITHLHVSELAFWSSGSAHEQLTGLMETVPEMPGTVIVIESTANGLTGVFANLWKGAVNGTNGFTPLFEPWFIDPGYREPANDNFVPTFEEEDLIRRHKLSFDQLAFRRKKIAVQGADYFKQEYPSEPAEAFLTTGRPVFDVGVLNKMREDAREPIARKTFMVETPGEPTPADKIDSVWEEHERGELLCYKAHDPTMTYYIGVDVGAGLQHGDYSAAIVMDAFKEVVAVLRAHLHPDFLAEVLYALGGYYNWAQLCVENNNHGVLTCTRLGKDYAYPAMYRQIVEDKVTFRESEVIGFRTTQKSKTMVVNELRAALRDGEVVIPDATVLEECMSFIQDELGRFVAEADCYDDTVIALSLANYINEGLVEPIRNEESWYLEAI